MRSFGIIPVVGEVKAIFRGNMILYSGMLRTLGARSI